MDFTELVELVQTGEAPPGVLSDFRTAAYRHLRLIRQISERLQSDLAVDCISPAEYQYIRKELNDNYRWLQQWFAREEQRELIHCEERKKLLVLGQLYKQALEENNKLALHMADLWSGIRGE